jgi:acyl carrier protein
VSDRAQAQAVKTLIVDYLARCAGVDPKRLSDAQITLDSLGIDSLSMVEMLWELEDKLGLHVEDTAQLPGMTLDQLVAHVAREAQPAT